MKSVREFLESSTIHGLVYISTNNPLLVRLSWLCVVISGFTGAGVIIQQSFSHWASSPVSTTIETLPITELDFPNVIVCPPRGSYTSLIPDLVMARNITLDPERRRELSDSVPGAVIGSDDEQVQFYRKMFEDFSAENIVKTLARILFVAKEKKLAKGRFKEKKILKSNIRV